MTSGPDMNSKNGPIIYYSYQTMLSEEVAFEVVSLVQMYFFVTACHCGIFDATLTECMYHHYCVWTTHVFFYCWLCQQNEFEEQATRRVDDLLESYMGIRDLELGKTTHMTLAFLKQTLCFSQDVKMQMCFNVFTHKAQSQRYSVGP